MGEKSVTQRWEASEKIRCFGGVLVAVAVAAVITC
jgi:hypothetical protein